MSQNYPHGALPPEHPPRGQESQNGSQYNNQTHQNQDPSSLLSVYPFMTYAPTARVAQHLSPHTTYPSSAPSASEIYPQYAQSFSRLDRPQDVQDWQMRQAAEARIRDALIVNANNGYGYRYGPLPTPESYGYQQGPLTPVSNSQPSYSFTQQMPYSYLPAYLPPTPSSTGHANGLATPDSVGESPTASMMAGRDFFEGFVNTTLERGPFPSQVPLAATKNQPRPQPLSREHLNQSRTQPQTQIHHQHMFAGTSKQVASQSPYQQIQAQNVHPCPPTLPPFLPQQQYPSATLTKALGKSPQKRPSVSAMAMRSPHPASSVASTPTHERILSSPALSSSPDPLGLPGPSPSKRPRGSKDYSPTWALQKSTSDDMALGRLNMRDQSTGASSSTSAEDGSKIILRIPSRLATPHRSSHVEDKDAEGEDEEEDELEWSDMEVKDENGDVDMVHSSPAPGYGATMPIPMSGKTGERDIRSSWQKLQVFLEDIFEESDSFPANPTLDDLKSTKAKFFSSISKDGSQALLSTETLSKIIRYVLRVRAVKQRQNTGTNGEGTWDVDIVGSLLRLLERNIRDAEGVLVFPEDRKATIVIEEKSTKKQGKGKAAEPSSLTFAVDEGDIKMGDCEINLARVKGGVTAAECCLVLLDSEGLSKQVYSEDLMSSCVQMLKEQLTRIVLPIVLGLSGEKIGSTYLAYLVQQESLLLNKHIKAASPLSTFFRHPLISSIAQSICSSLPRLTSLISREDFNFSETLVIQTVYLAKEPLFVVEAGGKKKGEKVGMAVVKTLRMEALGLLRGAFARYEEQRQWIIEEVLSSLVGRPGQTHDQALFQLANGKSIHALSALLLQLIQASAYGASAKIRKMHTSAAEMEIHDAPEFEKKDPIEEESRLCSETIESALRSANMVATYIISKASSTKATKTSLETDYKNILNLFIVDLLTVLYRPEWPAASLYLSVFSRIMINALDESKTGTDATAAKGVALDYLADIAAKLKTLGMEMDGETKVPTIEEVVSEADVDGLNKLIAAQSSVRTSLNGAARNDGSFACSLDMMSVIWAQELRGGAKKATSVLDKLRQEKDDEAQDIARRLEIVAATLKSALRNAWNSDENLFEVSDPKLGESAVQASISVSRGRSLQNAAEPILHALLTTMGSSVIGLRTKALRGVGSVVMVDPEILRLHQIRAALEERLSDPSPGVRDAAVELVGKYLVQKPELATQYYPQIALRAMDSGLSVRKRVIKILKGIFATMEEKEMQVDICCKMVALIDDRDPSIKDLSIKTFTEMLFSGEGGDVAGLLVEILNVYKGPYSILEKAMGEVYKECENVGRKDCFGKVIIDIITRLIDATEQADFDTLSHITAIWLLVGINPSHIDTQKASVLLTYLRPPANVDDQTVNEVLLRIFQKVIPCLPRSASNFAQDLTKALLPMVGKPTGGFQSLQETIGCLCAVTNYLTKDWGKIVTVLKACEGRVRPMRQQCRNSNGRPPTLNTAIAMTMYITALVVEGCDLDMVAKSDAGVDTELRKITLQPIHQYLFETYLDFATLSSPHAGPTLCLGALFRSYPSLMSRPETTHWMQSVFDSDDLDGKSRLLGVINTFLESEAKKRTEGSTAKKDVYLLIGNTKDLQDSDYSTSIVQNNIEHIFDCARSQHMPTQNAALDVISFVVNQGLYSPVHTVPILVTLETAEDPVVAERALALHTTLHGKHANLVHVLFMDSAKASYRYQRSITAEPSGHRDGVALLSNWYGMLNEKRAWKHDFLKALCRAFDSDLDTEVDIGLVLYLAENLSTLGYKLQEEPMTVVHALSRIISTCSHLAALMEETTIEAEAHEVIAGKKVTLSRISGETIAASRLAEASIVVGLALLVKNHLVSLYHLPEDKCASHVPGKKSTVGDKMTQRRGMPVLDINRMPLVRGVRTVGEFRDQQACFLGLLQEDGALTDEEHL